MSFGPRRVIVMFCDMKSSTPALRILEKEFKRLQLEFLKACEEIVAAANAETASLATNSTNGFPPYSFIIDKFLGDGVLLYADCGTSSPVADRDPGLAKVELGPAVGMLRIVKRLSDKITSLKAKHDCIHEKLKDNGIELGLRFGIAAGDNATVSIFSHSHTAPLHFILTGEVVNLAARLEHATAAEFIATLSKEEAELQSYTSALESEGQVRGSALGRALYDHDRQIIDVFEVCKKNYEIRADETFRNWLENERDSARFAWKEISFAPKGFASTRTAHLLGGNNSQELLRVV